MTEIIQHKWSFLHVWSNGYLPNTEGDQGHAHHQQVQEVEVVPTERPFMEERAERSHLNTCRDEGEDCMQTSGVILIDTETCWHFYFI